MSWADVLLINGVGVAVAIPLLYLIWLAIKGNRELDDKFKELEAERAKREEWERKVGLRR